MRASNLVALAAYRKDIPYWNSCPRKMSFPNVQELVVGGRAPDQGDEIFRFLNLRTLCFNGSKSVLHSNGDVLSFVELFEALRHLEELQIRTSLPDFSRICMALARDLFDLSIASDRCVRIKLLVNVGDSSEDPRLISPDCIKAYVYRVSQILCQLHLSNIRNFVLVCNFRFRCRRNLQVPDKAKVRRIARDTWIKHWKHFTVKNERCNRFVNTFSTGRSSWKVSVVSKGCTMHGADGPFSFHTFAE